MAGVLRRTLSTHATHHLCAKRTCSRHIHWLQSSGLLRASPCSIVDLQGIPGWACLPLGRGTPQRVLPTSPCSHAAPPPHVLAVRGTQLNDATFDKFKSLHHGDKFIDPMTRTLQAKNESRKQNVGAPFKAASPMKKSTGLGDYYGTLAGKTQYIPVRDAARCQPEVVGAMRAGDEYGMRDGAFLGGGGGRAAATLPLKPVAQSSRSTRPRSTSNINDMGMCAEPGSCRVSRLHACATDARMLVHAWQAGMQACVHASHTTKTRNAAPRAAAVRLLLPELQPPPRMHTRLPRAGQHRVCAKDAL